MFELEGTLCHLTVQQTNGTVKKLIEHIPLANDLINKM
jgi:hypothetical protein